MSYDAIQYGEDQDEMQVTITLDRPNSMNAISSTMIDELINAFIGLRKSTMSVP